MEVSNVSTETNLSDFNVINWDSKVLAMPNIPRGKGYPLALKAILDALEKNDSYDSPVFIDGSERKDSLNKLCIRLRPVGIVSGNPKEKWSISSESLKWMETYDHFQLAVFLNNKIKFFFEILNIISQEKCGVQKILGIATKQYQIPWKTKQEVIARLNWLKDLNLVEYEDYTYSYLITRNGLDILEGIGYIDYRMINKATDFTIEETEIKLSEWSLNLVKEGKENDRKDGIGYFPGNVNKMHITLMDYLELMEKPKNIEEIVKYSKDKYGIKDSSVKSFMTPLKHLEFIKQISKTEFQSTNKIDNFSKEYLELDFACCIHNKYKFVFEILLELSKKNLKVKEILEIGKVSYDFNYKDSSEIHKRVHILKNAGLIREEGADSYALTNRGNFFYKTIIKYLRLKKTENSDVKKEKHTSLNEIIFELKDSSQDSTNPNRFEKSLKDSLSLLGFTTKHIGGSGKTDVLLHAPTAPNFTYSVTVDAKSTYYNEVPDSAVDFITINEHKKIHDADYAVVVGRNFSKKSRLITRAHEHNVLLLDVDSLEQLIRWHTEVPLNADAYKKLFSQNGLVNIKVLEEDRNKILREGYLMQSILECLSEQSNDIQTKGIVSPREIYIMLRKDKQFGSTLEIDEIKLMLNLLSSPLIGCVGKVKEEYYALGSLNDAAQKFKFYFKSCSIDKLFE